MSTSVCVAVALLIPACALAFEWESDTPESQGMSSQALADMSQALQEHGTQALLIIRHDRIVYEWYAPKQGRHVTHYTASLAKALVGGGGLMLAMDQGLIGPDDLACKYVPAWRDDPVKSRVTIRQLATHTSGIENAEQDGIGHMQLPGWKGEFWRQDPNPIVSARDDAPVVFEPGTDYAYSNPGMAMLGYCVAAALAGSAQPDMKRLMAEKLMDPIGAGAKEWGIGYGKVFQTDGLPVYGTWGGGSWSPDAVARVGRLMLRRGDWEGAQLVRPETVDLMLTDAGMPASSEPGGPRQSSGLCWWLNWRGAYAGVPRDVCYGAGAGHQLLVIIPSLDLIAVRFGNAMASGEFTSAVHEYLLKPLVAAIIGPPLPASEVFEGVDFAPVEQIRFGAGGSDNWPITWGDDDAQYTSYGDGWGFEPRTEVKLSLGLARVTGGPEDFRGENIRSETGERTGDGASGPKASGMVMVDGVLYMLVRNTGNSQLVWSADHGRTWTWGFSFTESFGCPAFLNFGRDYAGARDEWVYVFSSDGPSAYESYDGVVLARAPVERITEQGAWEFLSGYTAAGEPVWSAEVADRLPVLSYPGHCRRLDVVYDAPQRRYLMALGHDDRGSWGIYDASEPWGPWSVVWHTDDWELGQTHGYRLPAKWISPDGLSLHLIFSGRRHEGVEYDAFCVRRMTLQPRPNQTRH